MMPFRKALTSQKRYEKHDKPAEDKCRVDHRRIRRTSHGQVVESSAELYSLENGLAIVKCHCSYAKLVIAEGVKDAMNCPGCGCRLYVEIDVKIMRVL